MSYIRWAALCAVTTILLVRASVRAEPASHWTLNGSVIARTLIDDTSAEATFLEMLPPPEAINHRPNRLIANSRIRFGRKRQSVEDKITQFLR